mmetsp:Transcript_9953/g.24212  ORF Transcript_9953/g.24212 Transcript_9953/m.24212 type:complete len:362 (+) Transcript_9953:330-1415(+)
MRLQALPPSWMTPETPHHETRQDGSKREARRHREHPKSHLPRIHQGVRGAFAAAITAAGFFRGVFLVATAVIVSSREGGNPVQEDGRIAQVGVFGASVHEPCQNTPVVNQPEGFPGRKFTGRSTRFFVDNIVKLDQHHASVWWKIRRVPDLFAERHHERVNGRVVPRKEGKVLLRLHDFGPQGSHIHLGEFRVVEPVDEGHILNDIVSETIEAVRVVLLRVRVVLIDRFPVVVDYVRQAPIGAHARHHAIEAAEVHPLWLQLVVDELPDFVALLGMVEIVVGLRSHSATDHLLLLRASPGPLPRRYNVDLSVGRMMSKHRGGTVVAPAVGRRLRSEHGRQENLSGGERPLVIVGPESNQPV